MKFLKWLWNDFKLRVIQDNRGIIGTTAAIIMGTAAVASAGAAAYSSSQARKAAETQAEAGAAASAADIAYAKERGAPGFELEQAQVEAWKNIYGPMAGRVGPQLEAQLDEPFRLPQEYWQQVWQKGKERISAEYQPLMQKTTERVAGMGPGKLESPVAQKLFADIEKEKVRTIEDLAIDQTIAEWTEGVTAKQQAQENIFRFMGFQPSTGFAAPSVPGTYVPPIIPAGTTGIGEGIKTGARIASLFGSQPETGSFEYWQRQGLASTPSAAYAPQSISFGGQPLSGLL